MVGRVASSAAGQAGDGSGGLGMSHRCVAVPPYSLTLPLPPPGSFSSLSLGFPI